MKKYKYVRKIWYNIHEVIIMDEIRVNNEVLGQVTGVTKYGVFMSLQDNYNGMVHISEVSNKYVQNLERKFRVGDIVKVKILDIDENKLQVKLSIKKIHNNQKKSKGIVEKGMGFMPLSQNLPMWIQKKVKELEKNN